MAEPIRLLVADDHALFREGLRALLSATPDMRASGMTRVFSATGWALMAGSDIALHQERPFSFWSAACLITGMSSI